MISNILTYFELRFGTCSMFYENINDKLKAPKTRLFMRKLSLLIQKTSRVHSGRLQRVRMNGLTENDFVVNQAILLTIITIHKEDGLFSEFERSCLNVCKWA